MQNNTCTGHRGPLTGGPLPWYKWYNG